MFKLALGKAEEPEIKLPTSIGSSKKQERVPEKCLLLLYWLCQNLWLCEPQKLWKILKELGIPDHLTCLWRNMYTGQEATVRTGHGTIDWFQIGKGICQGCICHPAYLTYMQNTSWEMLDWMKHKLESRFLREISIISDCRWHHLYDRKQRTKESLDERERREWKSWLKSKHSET